MMTYDEIAIFPYLISGSYDKRKLDIYSPKILHTVESLLTHDPKRRPDATQVGISNQRKLSKPDDYKRKEHQLPTPVENKIKEQHFPFDLDKDIDFFRRSPFPPAFPVDDLWNARRENKRFHFPVDNDFVRIHPIKVEEDR